MKEYKSYWKNGRKRNITWETKLARYLEHHTSLEYIRQDLFKVFDEGLDDYELYKKVEEEYAFYVKGYKLAVMDGISADDIDFKLWDDAMIPKMLLDITAQGPFFWRSWQRRWSGSWPVLHRE